MVIAITTVTTILFIFTIINTIIIIATDITATEIAIHRNSIIIPIVIATLTRGRERSF